MTKIMVVDDEADLESLIRLKFRQKIREQKYDFLFAANGREAIQKLDHEKDVSIILSDINMPEMDGLTLLSTVSQSHPLVQTVMVSAYGDMENIRIAMNRGAFDFITKPVNFDDLERTMEKTIKHVNQIKSTITALKENNILKMYVDESVLNFMTTRDFEESLHESEAIDATVAFIDISSFTSISESAEPEVVVKMLNAYFDLMAQEVIAEQGIIDKFIGDCVMAVFKGNFHLDRAIDACLNIRNKIQHIPEEIGFRPNISVGINCGHMVSGNIGSKTIKRLDFTVIGDTVNVAQRLQSTAKPGQILINEDCFHKIQKSFICNKLGPTMLKNKALEMVLYEVIK